MIIHIVNKFSKIKISPNFIQWSIVIGIFMEKYFELLIISLTSLLIYRNINCVKINANLLIAIIAFFFFSLLIITLNQYPYEKFVQQYSLLSIYLLLYYYIFKILKFDITALFYKYLTISYWVALIGIIQFIVFFVFNIDICRFIYDWASPPIISPRIIRVYSILDEPGYLSTSLLPAVVYCVLSSTYGLKMSHKRCFVIVSTFLLTFSAAGYLIFMILLLYRYVILNKYKYLIILLVIILFLAFGSFGIYKFGEQNKNEDFFLTDIYTKIDETVSVFSLMDPIYFERTNLSTYATMSNVWVAIHAPSRLLGTGIGTHAINYKKLYQSDFQHYGLNMNDGYSLFNRIFSELGVFGLIILVLFLYKNYNKRDIVNVCIFFVLLMLCLRGGNYVRYGIIFYFYLFFYTRPSVQNT